MSSLSSPDDRKQSDESTGTIGLILCGGQSSRMGRDKGLVELPGSSRTVTFVDKAIALLRPFVSQIYLSLRENQASLYADRCGSIEYVRFIFDEPIASGPLRGLLSAHKAMPDASILLLAVDMVYVQARHIETLLNGQGQSLCYRHSSGYFEPLLGLYTCNDLDRIAEWSACHPEIGISYWLQKLKIRSLLIEEDEAPYFRSLNSAQDFESGPESPFRFQDRG